VTITRYLNTPKPRILANSRTIHDSPGPFSTSPITRPEYLRAARRADVAGKPGVGAIAQVAEHDDRGPPRCDRGRRSRRHEQAYSVPQAMLFAWRVPWSEGVEAEAA
jgi:hypothetical protein